ncbi:MAG TPA: hypothetical protein VJ722_09820 [Rhodanobacteraceae bacterium]|nr:hypothetical protein [Rhodanobacteraceae bacterium]
MRLLVRMLALSRAARMRRQFRDIEQRTLGLPPPTSGLLAELIGKECAAAGRLDTPHLYGSPPDLKPGSPGTGMDLGHDRARSDNVQVQLRGIALWIAVAYHETRDSSFPEYAELHRDVLRVMRQIKERAAGPADRASAWMKGKSEAAA